MPCLEGVHRCDRVVHAANAKPPLAAWIAIEPVGVPGPLGAIGGVVKVHESLSCTHNDDQYIIEWRLVASQPATGAQVPRTLSRRHARCLPPRHHDTNTKHHDAQHAAAISPRQRQWRRHSAPRNRTQPEPQQGRRRECGMARSGEQRADERRAAPTTAAGCCRPLPCRRQSIRISGWGRVESFIHALE